MEANEILKQAKAVLKGANEETDKALSVFFGEEKKRKLAQEMAKRSAQASEENKSQK